MGRTIRDQWWSRHAFPMCMYHYNSTTIHPPFHLWKVALNHGAMQNIGGTSVYSVKWDGKTGSRWLHTASLLTACVNKESVYTLLFPFILISNFCCLSLTPNSTLCQYFPDVTLCFRSWLGHSLVYAQSASWQSRRYYYTWAEWLSAIKMYHTCMVQEIAISEMCFVPFSPTLFFWCLHMH